MSVRWPDGSLTGSVRVQTPAPTVDEPEPDTSKVEDSFSSEKKEVKDAAR